MRRVLVHLCPAVPTAPNNIAGITISISAVSSTIIALFPPSSRMVLPKREPTTSPMRLPIGVLPVAEIKGTQYKIRRHDCIWAEDPLVRELQKRYFAGQNTIIEEFTKKNDVRHPNQENTAIMNFKFVKKIIKDIKSEVGNGGLVSIDDTEAQKHQGHNANHSIKQVFKVTEKVIQ